MVMHRPKIALVAAFFFVHGMMTGGMPPIGQDSPAYSRSAAGKIQSALDRVGKAGPPPPSGLRSLDFSEDDLNAYIAFRIAAAKEDILRVLRIKIYESSRIEGWMELDFGRHRIPSWVKKRMSLYFDGGITVRDGRVRFDFKSLFVGKEPMPIMLLDMIIFIASELGKTDAKGVNDWHSLPDGIRDIRTSAGRFALYY